MDSSLERVRPGNHAEVVVDAGLVNEVKSHPAEAEDGLQGVRRIIRATFRHHAKVRLQERTSLEPEAFLSMLDGNLSVSVGVEPFTRRRHRLVYSVADRAHFVAIQDFETGEVVTVLPIDYHENLAWKLSEESLRKAVRLADPDLHQVLYRTPSTPPARGVSCEVLGVFFDEALRSRKHRLGAHRFEMFPENPEDALAEESFIAKVLAKVQQRNLNLDALLEIIIAHDKSGLICQVPWHVIEGFALDLHVAEPGDTARGTATLPATGGPVAEERKDF